MLSSGMSPTPDTDEPVVEGKPGKEPEDLTGRALRLRIRQQELLAELGVLALQRTSFTDLLNYTARMTAEGLDAEYCKIMLYQRRWIGLLSICATSLALSMSHANVTSFAGNDEILPD